MQGFFPVVQCVMSAKYKMPGLSLNTGAGVVTPKTIDALTKLIDAGIGDRRELQKRQHLGGATDRTPSPMAKAMAVNDGLTFKTPQRLPFGAVSVKEHLSAGAVQRLLGVRLGRRERSRHPDAFF